MYKIFLLPVLIVLRFLIHVLCDSITEVFTAFIEVLATNAALRPDYFQMQ